MTSARGKRPSRVLVACNVDWFLLSHRAAVLTELLERGCIVYVVADTSSGEWRVEPRVGWFGAYFGRGQRPIDHVRGLVGVARAIHAVQPEVVIAVTAPAILATALVQRILHPSRTCVWAFGGLGEAWDTLLNTATGRAVSRALLAHRNARVIVQSDPDRARLESVLGKGTPVLKTLGSGVDPSEFSIGNSDCSEAREGIVIATGARLIEGKGLSEFLALRRAVGCQTRASWRIYGLVDREHPRALDPSMFAEKCAASEVELVLDEQHMASALSDVDIFVYLSTYGEGVPKMVLEALCAGCATVALKGFGMADVKQAVGGAVILAESVQHVTLEVLRLAVDSRERWAMSATAQALALEAFDQRSVASRIVDFALAGVSAE